MSGRTGSFHNKNTLPGPASQPFAPDLEFAEIHTYISSPVVHFSLSAYVVHICTKFIP